MENLNNSQSPAEPPMTPDQLAAGRELEAMRADATTARAVAMGDPEALARYRGLQARFLDYGAARQEQTTPARPAASLPPDVAEARAEAEYDAGLLADVPTVPGLYQLDYSFRHTGLAVDDAFDSRFREAALAMGLPRRTAAQVWGRLTAAMATVHRTGATPSDNDLALGQRTGAEQLERLHGPDWSARLEDANNLIRALPSELRGWLNSTLETTGAGNDPAIIEALARVGAARRRQNLIKK